MNLNDLQGTGPDDPPHIVAKNPEVVKVRGYFETFMVEEFLIDMLIQVGMNKPDNPKKFLLRFIDDARGLDRSSSSSSSGSNTPRDGDDRFDERGTLYRRLSRMVDNESKNISEFVSNWAGEGSFEIMASKGLPSRSTNRNRSMSFDSQSSPHEMNPQDLESMLAWESNVLNRKDEDLEKFMNSYLQYVGQQHDMPIEAPKIRSFVKEVSFNYNSKVAYHNMRHATSVVIVLHQLLESGGREFLEPIDEFALVYAFSFSIKNNSDSVLNLISEHQSQPSR